MSNSLAENVGPDLVCIGKGHADKFSRCLILLGDFSVLACGNARVAGIDKPADIHAKILADDQSNHGLDPCHPALARCAAAAASVFDIAAGASTLPFYWSVPSNVVFHPNKKLRNHKVDAASPPWPKARIQRKRHHAA